MVSVVMLAVVRNRTRQVVDAVELLGSQLGHVVCVVGCSDVLSMVDRSLTGSYFSTAHKL